MKYKIVANNKRGGGPNHPKLEFSVKAETLGEAKTKAYEKLKAEGFQHAIVEKVTEVS